MHWARRDTRSGFSRAWELQDVAFVGPPGGSGFKRLSHLQIQLYDLRQSLRASFSSSAMWGKSHRKHHSQHTAGSHSLRLRFLFFFFCLLHHIVTDIPSPSYLPSSLRKSSWKVKDTITRLHLHYFITGFRFSSKGFSELVVIRQDS